MLRIMCAGTAVRDANTNDPAEGKKRFTAVTLVTDRYAGTNPDNTPKYESIFLNCIAFDRTAEALAKVCKGDKVYVMGEPSVNVYEKDGKTTYTLQCNVREYEKIVSAAKISAPAKAVSDEEDVPGTGGDDSDPFN